MRRERRRPTPRELAKMTSRRPVVWKPHAPEGTLPARAGKSPFFASRLTRRNELTRHDERSAMSEREKGAR